METKLSEVLITTTKIIPQFHIELKDSNREILFIAYFMNTHYIV